MSSRGDHTGGFRGGTSGTRTTCRWDHRQAPSRHPSVYKCRTWNPSTTVGSRGVGSNSTMQHTSNPLSSSLVDFVDPYGHCALLATRHIRGALLTREPRWPVSRTTPRWRGGVLTTIPRDSRARPFHWRHGSRSTDAPHTPPPTGTRAGEIPAAGSATTPSRTKRSISRSDTPHSLRISRACSPGSKGGGRDVPRSDPCRRPGNAGEVIFPTTGCTTVSSEPPSRRWSAASNSG